MAWADNAVMFAVLAPLLLLAERIAPESAAPSGPSCSRAGLGREGRVTDWAFALTGLAVAPAVWLGLAGAAGSAGRHGPLRPVFAALPPAAQWLAGFLLVDLGAYWLHRGEHAAGLLWRLHSVHHSPHHLDWLSGRRFHPVDAVAQQLLPVAAVVALGVRLGSLEPYLVVATVVTILAHCDLAIPCGPLRWIVVTPGYHRSHHEAEGADANFALVLPLMDKVFGTASTRPVRDRSFGTVEDVPTVGFVRLVAWGFGLPPRQAQRAKISKPAQNDTALAT